MGLGLQKLDEPDLFCPKGHSERGIALVHIQKKKAPRGQVLVFRSHIGNRAGQNCTPAVQQFSKGNTGELGD